MTVSEKGRKRAATFLSSVFSQLEGRRQKSCDIWLKSRWVALRVLHIPFDAARPDISGHALRPTCPADRWCEGGGSSENVGHQISGTDSKCCRAAICWGYHERRRIVRRRFNAEKETSLIDVMNKRNEEARRAFWQSLIATQPPVPMPV